MAIFIKSICLFDLFNKTSREDKYSCFFHISYYGTCERTTRFVPLSWMIADPLLIEIDDVFGHKSIINPDSN